MMNRMDIFGLAAQCRKQQAGRGQRNARMAGRGRKAAHANGLLFENLEARMLLSAVQFAPQLPTAISSNAFSGTAADINGDGKMDLIATNYNTNTVSVLLGNGDGTFLPKVDYATGTGPSSVTSGNFGNGQIDLAVANTGSGTVSVLLGNGDGTFSAAVNYTVGADPVSIVAADFAGNGRLDLAVVNYGNNSVSILMGNGNGTFAARRFLCRGQQPAFPGRGRFQRRRQARSGGGQFRHQQCQRAIK